MISKNKQNCLNLSDYALSTRGLTELLFPEPSKRWKVKPNPIENIKLVRDCESCKGAVAIQERLTLLMMDADNAADKDRMASCVNFF